MEVVGAVPQGEWGVCSDEGELMAQLLGNCSFPNEEMNDTNFVVSPAFWATHDESNQNIGVVDDQVAMYCNDETNSASMCSFSQGSSYSSILFPFSSQESYYSSSSTLSHHLSLTNNNVMTMDYCMMEGKNDSTNVMGGDHDFLNQDLSNDSTESNDEIVRQGKNKMELGLVVPMPQVLPREDKNSSPSESKKRCRIPCDVPRSRKSIKFNKCPKFDESDDEISGNNNNNKNAVVFQRQSSSSCCSEDESNEMSCSSSKGSQGIKQRASRGSATDPQSLYARKRRERINERLRILQTLVPNGTKVDISTMLEEAVEYVKFLQLQIKLLSSDDLWMYAPIAYNGMDIGLDLKISTPTPTPQS